MNSKKNLRVIKKPKEIQAIERACQLGDKTFKYILKKIKPGITEKQLAFEIEFFIKKNGADISFPPIVAFGANSSIPHHKTSNKQLATRELVLLDFGVKLNNYCSDMTRVVFFAKANPKQKKIYQIVLEAQECALEYLSRRKTPRGWPASQRGEPNGLPRGGEIKAKEVDKVARDYIINAGFPTIPHGLGHGVGLEVHEPPRLSPKSKDILKPGMVFSIEPGIYLPGKFGVRLEDLVVLEKSGPRLLTNSSKELLVI